jgi:hypothetical protein
MGASDLAPRAEIVIDLPHLLLAPPEAPRPNDVGQTN